VIDSSVLVTETEILDAMRRVRDLKSLVIEGAAAVAVAGFLKNAGFYPRKRVAVVICGSNVSEKVLSALG
jgi:threonine dehydratase